MRKLVWFSVGFMLGCIPVAYFVLDRLFLAVAIICILAGVGMLFCKARFFRCASLALMGAGIALLWSWGFDAVYLQPARNCDAENASAEITVTDYSYDTDYGIAAEGQIKIDGRWYDVRMYLDDMAQLSPGDVVSGTFRLRLTAVGGMDDATYHRTEGCFLLAYAKDSVQVRSPETIPPQFFPAQLRNRILLIIDSVFPESVRSFARALLLGDTTKLTYEEDTAFKVSGIRHVIAVSGLHVSILFALVYILSGKHRFFTALFGIPVLILFAAVAGFTPSILRACIMQSLMIIALLLKKEYDPPTALAFAVLFMLGLNPMAVASVSFQLSVGCMVGIFLFCRKINDYFLNLFQCPKDMSFKAKLIRWISGGIAVTLSAMAVTTPLSVTYFGSVSIIGVITNLLCLWVVSFVFYGIMVTCIIGAVWLPVGKVIAFVVSIPIKYILAVADGLSAIPIASVYTCSIYVLLWVYFSYLLIGAFLLKKKKKPGLLAASIAIGLFLSLAVSYIEPRLDELRVTVIDVGQGQSILIQNRGNYYLVDCGGDDPETAADTVSQTLLSQGIFRLDGVFVTHYDSDHVGGIGYLLGRIKTDSLYLPDIADESGVMEKLKEDFDQSVEIVSNKLELNGDWGKLTAIPGDKNGDENENSMCILFQAENCDILITGDRDSSGERKLLKTVDLPELELLVVGHHGAKTATSFELLSVTSPQTAVISVGEDNFYGHPSPDVLKRLEMFGCRILRTDLKGTIVFRR